jgi:hypothetical protein
MTHDPSVIPVAAEAAEKKFIEQRRQLQDPPHTPDRDAPWGLAMSGGGIRSATFALGVLQALARSPVRSAAQPPDGAATGWPAGALHKASLLSRFDYLSTVSGGGYLV